MARPPREQLECPACGWTGRTSLGSLRLAIFVSSTATALILVGLELAGVLALGDSVWAIALTLMLVSIGVRALIRGDRCPACGAEP